eukprot:2724889-Rhodomonas_salina.1
MLITLPAPPHCTRTCSDPTPDRDRLRHPLAPARLARRHPQPTPQHCHPHTSSAHPVRSPHQRKQLAAARCLTKAPRNPARRDPHAHRPSHPRPLC